MVAGMDPMQEVKDCLIKEGLGLHECTAKFGSGTPTSGAHGLKVPLPFLALSLTHPDGLRVPPLLTPPPSQPALRAGAPWSAPARACGAAGVRCEAECDGANSRCWRAPRLCRTTVCPKV